jgi:phage/conjugal plasmid C-4 type zinc finger TraR family protein
MAGGWAPDGAVQDQIDDTVKDAISFARARMPSGESATECEECGEPIPERRREALPGVRTCVQCQSGRDSRPALSPFNRRGSKDSQLR